MAGVFQVHRGIIQIAIIQIKTFNLFILYLNNKNVLSYKVGLFILYLSILNISALHLYRVFNESEGKVRC